VGSLTTGEDNNIDVEPVSREMKGREAIRIVDMFKSFHVILVHPSGGFVSHIFYSTVASPKSRPSTESI
jgi:hypothetical protein